MRPRAACDRDHHHVDKAKKNAARIRALKKPFTIVAIPDTQVYSEEGDPGFAKQVDWVLANAIKQNIVFVTHLGDVVDNGTDAEQWTNAMAALDPLLQQDMLPFSIVRGNHDDPTFFLAQPPALPHAGQVLVRGRRRRAACARRRSSASRRPASCTSASRRTRPPRSCSGPTACCASRA